MLPLFLTHPDLLLALPWAGGLVVEARRTRPRPAVALALALALGAALAAGLDRAPGLLHRAGLVDPEGVTRAGGWWLVAALALATARSPAGPPAQAAAPGPRALLRALLPLGMAGLVAAAAAGPPGLAAPAGGALVAGVLLLATDGLAPRRPARWWWAGAAAALALGSLLDAERLGLSLALRGLGLGLDGTVALAIALALVPTLVGHGLLLRAAGPDGPPSRRHLGSPPRARPGARGPPPAR